MVISLAEAKSYLRVDFADDDTFISGLIETGERLTADTVRKDLSVTTNVTSAVKIAVLFAVAYLYEHREDANMNDLTRNLRYILMTEREAAF